MCASVKGPGNIKDHQSSSAWKAYSYYRGRIVGGGSTNTEYQAGPEEHGHDERRTATERQRLREQTRCVWGTVTGLAEVLEFMQRESSLKRFGRWRVTSL